MFDLRVIYSNSFLGIVPSNPSSPRNRRERGKPPNRENNKPNKETPCMERGRILIFRFQVQRPRRRSNRSRPTRISHMISTRPTDRRCVGCYEGTNRNRHFRHTSPPFGSSVITTALTVMCLDLSDLGWGGRVIRLGAMERSCGRSGRRGGCGA